MTKKEVLQRLGRMIESENNITKKHQLARFTKLVHRSMIEEWNANINKYGSINVGHLGETIVLKWLGLEKEDRYNEVKTLVCNTPNILTNDGVKVAYFLVCCNSLFLENGLYRVNATDILNKRVGIKELINIRKVQVCGLEDLI